MDNMSKVPNKYEQEINGGKNCRKVKCNFCSSIILAVNIGEYVHTECQLPFMEQKDQDRTEYETVYDFWTVEDMFKFENIGFSNTVGNQKFLSCADCERGPIGYHDLSTKKSYVALNRVDHV